MGGGGGGEGFRGGAVGAGEDIFPDDLQNITTTTPPHHCSPGQLYSSPDRGNSFPQATGMGVGALQGCPYWGVMLGASAGRGAVAIPTWDFLEEGREPHLPEVLDEVVGL